MSQAEKINLSRVAFKIAFYLFLFLVGGIYAINNWQPFKFFSEGFNHTFTFIKEQIQVRPALLKEIVYSNEGVNIYDPKQALEGLTLLQGTLPGGTQVRLIDMSGKEIHRWPVSFFKIWPNPKHIADEDIPKTDFNYHTQGLTAFPDGSIVINVGDKGTAKLNKCGNVEWTINRETHHSITPTGNGGFWIPAHRPINDIPDHLLFLDITREKLKYRPIGLFHGFSYENILLLVDQNGKPIKEFSVLQSLYDAGFESELLDAILINFRDPTHINDIDIVNQALADKISIVNKGDLLVSMRQTNMLAILDQFTGALKWHFTGHWIRQHDPDITSEGNIVIFNNGHDKFAFNRIPGSNLIELDPETGTTKIIYPLGDQKEFYSDILGAHQILDNGNHLITESRAGRVFEINPKGKIVWDYVIHYDDTHASLIALALRLKNDFFNVENWNCH